MTSGRVYSTGGWMNYKVKMPGKERCVVWRNHNTPYIKIDGKYIRVWFNPFEADERETTCEVDI